MLVYCIGSWLQLTLLSNSEQQVLCAVEAFSAVKLQALAGTMRIHQLIPDSRLIVQSVAFVQKVDSATTTTERA